MPLPSEIESGLHPPTQGTKMPLSGLCLCPYRGAQCKPPAGVSLWPPPPPPCHPLPAGKGPGPVTQLHCLPALAAPAPSPWTVSTAGVGAIWLVAHPFSRAVPKTPSPSPRGGSVLWGVGDLARVLATFHLTPGPPQGPPSCYPLPLSFTSHISSLAIHLST